MSARRFLVVGEPFYRIGEFRYPDDTFKAGDVVTAEQDRADVDGDLVVSRENVTEAVNLECLVEIDEDGYPVTIPDVPLVGEDEDAELLAALAPLAVVILRGSL